MSTITIELDQAERHTLKDLLDRFIQERAVEAVQFARFSMQLEDAAARTRRLAHLMRLAEGEIMWLPADELDELRGDLAAWAAEATFTVDEHEARIVEVDEDPDRDQQERDRAIAAARRVILEDYAHRCVCERIIAQIDGAREAVSA